MNAEASRTLIERVRLEDGATTEDLHFIERALTQLFTQLSRFDPQMVDIGVRFKDRGRPGMRTSLELHVQGLPAMVGVSDLSDTKDALNDAEAKVLAQLRSNVTRRSDHHPRRTNV
ncbi:hypothetical protein OO014_17070 [Intrasporangium calvum]|uniref:HPF/RaiA family ribosome-associated protein n=1 Tax=Intrasporangium calvum TaxID=53358 RepID=A0ABT5GL46_9MICO|nr:hypothetical protein [Intrasporangium calvum]MDC5698967.1 hypothetical protein [Intrasporangium calvum]